MRRGGSRTLLLLGAVVAVAVFLILYVVLSSGSRGSNGPVATPTPVMVQVVSAVSDLPAYTVLTSDTLTLKQVDETTVLTTTARTVEEVTGLMTLRPYQAGDIISKADDALREPGVSRVLPKGLKAFGLALQEMNTFNQGITEGDTIDIIWSRQYDVTGYTQPPNGGAPEKVERQLSTTKTLLQSVQVLRVVSLLATAQNTSGQVVNPSGGTTDQQQQAQQRAQAAVQAEYAADAPPTMLLILAVTDQQAEVIKFAREQGTIDIALRAAGDIDPERTSGITDRILVDDYKVVMPELLIK